jgi:hypothetical protein
LPTGSRSSSGRRPIIRPTRAYVFGHGSPEAGVTGNRADLLKKRDYLTTLLDFTRKQMAAGKTRDDLGTFEVLAGLRRVSGLR